MSSPLRIVRFAGRERAAEDASEAFGNDTDEPARLLVLHAPAMDAYFTELDALWSGPEPPAPEQERALMARFGLESA